MKKGFTLVEVLAVIVILGLMAVIFVPNTIKILKENNLKIYKIKENELIKAAKDYAEYDEGFIAPTSSGTYKYVTMPQLVKGSYMNKIIDTTSGKECSAFVRISLNDIYGYNYEACLICEEYKTNKDFCSAVNYSNL